MIASPESAAASPRSPAGRRPHRERRSATVALLAAAVLVLAARAPAHAHARLKRSAPENGATVAAPAAIELWFNELLDDEFNDVAVYRATRDGDPADDQNLATAKPQVDASDRTHLSTTVSALTTGAYVVQYKVLSRDGHSARGRVLFRVGELD